MFFQRKFVIQAIILTVSFILVAKLFYLQVIDDSYKLSADNNVLRKVIIYPARGVIMDRNDKILVQNEPVYDLMVIPRNVTTMDTLQFCEIIGISKEAFIEKLAKASAYSRVKESVFEKQLSAVTYATFQEKLFEYPGFYVQNRTVRKYPSPIAAHILGYIGEVDDRLIGQSQGYYRQGDYIGISGIEKSYESTLRGQRGIKNIMVDVFNRAQGSFEDGKYDTIAVSGERLISSLDAELQAYGERLMNNKIGSIVAIEPSTGEILALVSGPSYDPNLLVGRVRSKNYVQLLRDEYKPLFIRPIQAQYPPGSIFKPIMALIGQQDGFLTPNSRYPCGGGYRMGSRTVKCTHVHPPLNLEESIQFSCNAYYCHAFRDMIDQPRGKSVQDAYQHWRNRIEAFGIGVKLDVDIPNELKGLLPTSNYYDRIYGNGQWKSSNIISLSIGQGELGITPLQMANVMAAIANRGYYYNPHLVKAIGENNLQRPEYTTKRYVGIDSSYFEIVINGMQKVVDAGTAAYSKIRDIPFCGKTGTVQNPHGKDHSVFVGFAPRDNPKIAIAVVVENSGFGSVWAAPIASLMIEKYLKGEISRPKYFEDRILDANLLPQLVPAKVISQK